MISSFSPINERHVFCFFLLFSAFRQMLHPKPRARCHSCPAYIHSELVNGLTAENLNVHNALHSCDDIGNDKVYIDQMVNTFVDAQSQIIQREIFLSCYNRTQCQSGITARL
ncbi:hypothetical protein BD408DRAFT_422402 [Parasitella parasitica]|nr:hypothetical protein BD408DRAFT_422402 [Parasitella parasitica]